MEKYKDALLAEDKRLSEIAQGLTIEPLSFAQQALEIFNRHKKGITQLGKLAAGTIGAGVVVERVSHHYSH